MSGKNCDLYRGAVALAPMVRAGRIALRVLALKHGANLAYTEEIVDLRLLKCKRISNGVLGTIDYIFEDEVVLRIAEEEASKCILQIGSASVENAVKICKLIGQNKDVAGIDLNMGCPKPFSIRNGMGAALLSQRELVKEILTSMTAVSAVPVSCKIRVLDSEEETLELVRMIERCGVSSIAVHGRRRAERPNDVNRNAELRQLARMVDIPVLANGGSSSITQFSDIEAFRSECEADGVLIARKALAQPSIFRPFGVLTMQAEIQSFLDKCCEFDECFTATKYVIQRILGSAQEFDPKGRATVAAANNLEICRVWSMEEKYLSCRRRHRGTSENPETLDSVKSSTGIFEMVDDVSVAVGLSFAPKKLALNAGSGTPKCVLNAFCDEQKMKRPEFEMNKRSSDGRFEATVQVCGRKFRSSVAQPNKKMAEQVASLVALIGLKQRHRLKGAYEYE